MQIADIPSDVQKEFFDSEIKSVSVLSGGLLNKSYSVSLTDGEKFVLQKIKPLIESDLYSNYHAVSSHLKNLDWLTPVMLTPTHPTDKVLFTDGDGNRWCSFTQLENSTWDGDPAPIGDLLGKLHKDLKQLDYTPKGAALITDSQTRLEQLQKAVDHLPTQEAKELADKLLSIFDPNGLPTAPEQLIHADGKIDNMLFKDGKPYTFIGWKTLKLGNLWFDIGDMMRSIAKTLYIQNGRIDPEDIDKFVHSYHTVNDLGMDYAEFKSKALSAGLHITLELAIRYLADYKDGDDGYFGWDEGNYASRFDSNYAKALQLKRIYNEMKQ